MGLWPKRHIRPVFVFLSFHIDRNFLFPEFSFKRSVVFEAAKTGFGSSKLDKNESANHQAH